MKTYQLRSICSGSVRSARRMTTGCGAFRIASRRTRSGRVTVSHQATIPPQSWPTTAALFDAEGGDHGGHVGREPVEVVIADVRWLVAGVVTALVEGHDVETGVGERAELVPPAVPEFGEAVQENDWSGRSGRRPGRRGG